mmetsp:Transcript_2461/g.5854  ORF Transcript_2461/g.5854 Transcript_2461/m.5854 type:complete len:293 (+) Transcript_2461:333-1211(+)
MLRSLTASPTNTAYNQTQCRLHWCRASHQYHGVPAPQQVGTSRPERVRIACYSLRRPGAAAPPLVVQPQTVAVEVGTLHPARAIRGGNARPRVQQPLVVEDEQVPGLELKRHDVLRVVRQLRKAAPGAVECGHFLDAQGRRVLTALRGEAHSTQRVAGAVAALQLKVRRHVHQSRAPIATVVLEAHLHLAEQLEGLRVFFAQQLRNVVCVDHVVHDLAAVARRLTVRARAVLDGVQGLEVRGRPAIGVVGVETDGFGRVGQVHLFALVGLLGLIRLRAHVEMVAPIRCPQCG